MTSGSFQTFPIDSIYINRDKRQRREIEVDDLVDSIGRIGLINPPVVKRDGELIAGERRVTACRELGWTALPVQFAEDLDAVTLHLIELEENIKRKDLTWQEESAAVLEFHRLKGTQTPEWDMSKTAGEIGMSPNHVRQRIMVAEALEAGNERVAEAPKFSTAFGIVERAAIRQKTSDLKEIKVTAPAVETDDDTEEVPEELPVPLIQADFTEWQPGYRGPKFNFIHCDFPYGVDADNHAQGAAASHGGYADSFEDYSMLCDTLDSAMENVVAESAHLMFWFSMDYYQWTLERLSAMGWKVNPFPLIWYKSDNSGILPDPKRGPRRIYETAFMASRGDRFIVRSTSNLVASPNLKEIHMSEKPRPMLRKFFSMFVDEYSVMLDPTCGSGNSVAVAKELGAEMMFGLERDEDFYNLAVENFNND